MSRLGVAKAGAAGARARCMEKKQYGGYVRLTILCHCSANTSCPAVWWCRWGIFSRLVVLTLALHLGRRMLDIKSPMNDAHNNV